MFPTLHIRRNTQPQLLRNNASFQEESFAYCRTDPQQLWPQMSAQLDLHAITPPPKVTYTLCLSFPSVQDIDGHNGHMMVLRHQMFVKTASLNQAECG